MTTQTDKHTDNEPVCVCVCERETDRQTERDKKREREDSHRDGMGRRRWRRGALKRWVRQTTTASHCLDSRYERFGLLEASHLPSIHPSIHPSIRNSINPPTRPSIHPFIHPIHPSDHP